MSIGGFGLTDEERRLIRENAHQSFRRDQRLTVQLTKQDLTTLKTQAEEEGISHQTLMAIVLYKYVRRRLVEKHKLLELSHILKRGPSAFQHDKKRDPFELTYLDDEEKELIESIENADWEPSTPLTPEERERMQEMARDTFRRDQRVTVRMS